MFSERRNDVIFRESVQITLAEGRSRRKRRCWSWLLEARFRSYVVCNFPLSGEGRIQEKARDVSTGVDLRHPVMHLMVWLRILSSFFARQLFAVPGR